MMAHRFKYMHFYSMFIFMFIYVAMDCHPECLGWQNMDLTSINKFDR